MSLYLSSSLAEISQGFFKSENLHAYHNNLPKRRALSGKGANMVCESALAASSCKRLDLLRKDNSPLIVLFGSRTCPGSLLLPALDTAVLFRDNGESVISGFHSPLEQECLHVLLRGSQSIILCPARSINTMRMPGVWKQAMEEKRLLVLSKFSREKQRTSKALARERNQLVAALADTILIIHASPAGQTSTLVADAVKQHKKVFALDAWENDHLFQQGALPWVAGEEASENLKTTLSG